MTKPMGIGPSLGTPQLLQSYVVSPTAGSNYKDTPNICFNFSEPFPFLTGKSLTWIKPSDVMLEKSNTSNYPTLGGFDTSKPGTFKMMEQGTGAVRARKKRSIDQIGGQ